MFKDSILYSFGRSIGSLGSRCFLGERAKPPLSSDPKLSVLYLYARLFMNPIRRLSYLVAAFVVTNFVAGILAFAFECRPFAFMWNKTIAGGYCINTNQSYAYFSIPNLVSDVAIIFLPLRPLWKLQVPRSTKVGLFVTFSLGGL